MGILKRGKAESLFNCPSLSILYFPTLPPPKPAIIQDVIIHTEIRHIQPISALPDYELKEIPELDYIRPVAPPERSSGNLYDYHSCTWHVKEKRPDISNSWGNATEWFSNAQAMGWATGTEARAGAIGWTYGHVVYIEMVEGDQVYLSERNYDYNGSFRYRWADASEMQYIY